MIASAHKGHNPLPGCRLPSSHSSSLDSLPGSDTMFCFLPQACAPYILVHVVFISKELEKATEFCRPPVSGHSLVTGTMKNGMVNVTNQILQHVVATTEPPQLSEALCMLP